MTQLRLAITLRQPDAIIAALKRLQSVPTLALSSHDLDYLFSLRDLNREQFEFALGPYGVDRETLVEAKEALTAVLRNYMWRVDITLPVPGRGRISLPFYADPYGNVARYLLYFLNRPSSSCPATIMFAGLGFAARAIPGPTMLTDAEIQQLIIDLGDEDFFVREAAERRAKELLSRNYNIDPLSFLRLYNALRGARDIHPDPEVRNRATRILNSQYLANTYIQITIAYGLYLQYAR